MSEPVRSASAFYAAARPQVHSRRVSVQIGSFGLTYSTDRVLWNPDAPPVDPAPAVDRRPAGESQAEERPAFQDIEETRRQAALWREAEQRAARRQAEAQWQWRPEASAQAAQAADMPAAPGPRGSAGGTAGEKGRGTPLAGALGRACQAYRACAENFAAARPMLECVA